MGAVRERDRNETRRVSLRAGPSGQCAHVMHTSLLEADTVAALINYQERKREREREKVALVSARTISTGITQYTTQTKLYTTQTHRAQDPQLWTLFPNTVFSPSDNALTQSQDSGFRV